MKKLKSLFAAICATSAIFMITAVPAFAEAPKDNGSTAKSAVAEQLSTEVEESSAFPQWITFTAIGGVVVVGVIVGAVLIGRKNGKED